MLTPTLLLSIIATYFLVLILVSYLTGKDTANENFFMAGRKSPWYLIAFGMIGTSISGVTFLSVPGRVGATSFSYLQTVIGYLLGYFVIATILMPVYYRLNLVSIYTYLEKRFGRDAYKTGSGFFLLSRTIGSAFRLYLMALIIQDFIVVDRFPFWVTVLITIFLIWSYTFRGGVKTIVWTDALQTLCLVLSLLLTIVFISQKMDLSFSAMIGKVYHNQMSKTFFFENGWTDSKNFFKQFLAGASICIAMSGLDQDIMQKNLTCRTLKDAQKNMFWFSIMLVFVNLLFLTLGALLFMYAQQFGIEMPTRLVNGELKPATDLLLPTIALKHMAPIVGILFLLGIIASTYASSDSALAALTTAFCIDFLNFDKRAQAGENTVRLRNYVHFGFSILLFIVVVLFWLINDQSVLDALFSMASLTYGPLLGLFAFGFYTKRGIRDGLAPVVCIASPVLSYLIDKNSATLLWGYKFSFELLILNGLITFTGLWLISKKNNLQPVSQ